MNNSLKSKLYLSTIDSRAADLAQQYGLGIELAQFCYTEHMDVLFHEIEPNIHDCLGKSSRFIMHAPFAELSPATIDSMILELVKKRYRQAFDLARKFHIKRMVIHSGYVTNVYFKEWFIDRSIPFWKEFLKELPNDFELLYENVMDDEPYTMKKVLDSIDDPRFKFCLDVGHLNMISPVPAEEWICTYGNALGHVHLHNNHKDWDTHSALYDGTLNIPKIIEQVLDCSPDATFTLELMDAEPSLIWMNEKGLL